MTLNQGKNNLTLNIIPPRLFEVVRETNLNQNNIQLQNITDNYILFENLPLKAVLYEMCSNFTHFLVFLARCSNKTVTIGHAVFNSVHMVPTIKSTYVFLSLRILCNAYTYVSQNLICINYFVFSCQKEQIFCVLFFYMHHIL